MNKDTIKGAAKDAAGGMEKNIGRATGNEKMEAKGMAKQAEGKVQKAVGKTEDGIDRALKH